MGPLEKEANAGGSQTQSRRRTDPVSAREPLTLVVPEALRLCEPVSPFPLGQFEAGLCHLQLKVLTHVPSNSYSE